MIAPHGGPRGRLLPMASQGGWRASIPPNCLTVDAQLHGSLQTGQEGRGQVMVSEGKRRGFSPLQAT